MIPVHISTRGAKYTTKLTLRMDSNMYHELISAYERRKKESITSFTAWLRFALNEFLNNGKQIYFTI